jgi:hypothetical protein
MPGATERTDPPVTNETQEKIQAVVEMRFVLDTVLACLRGVADEAGKAEVAMLVAIGHGVEALATTVQRHRALARDLCDTLDHLGVSLDEMRLGFEREPGRVRIDVQDLDGRQAVLVSGGRLAAHSVEALERFMNGEGKLVVLETDHEFDHGARTVFENLDGKLAPVANEEHFVGMTERTVVGDLTIERDGCVVTTLRSPGGKRYDLHSGASPHGAYLYLSGFATGAHMTDEMHRARATTDGRPLGGDRSTYPDDNRVPTLEDVRAVETPRAKTFAPALAKLARVRELAFDESPAAMVVLAIRDVLGDE